MSLSGSLKYEATPKPTPEPTDNSWPGIVPTATGARLGDVSGTVTVKLCSAVKPPGSRAVTVTVAVPAPTADNVRLSPEAEARATPASELAAEYPSVSPSGSLKYDATPKAMPLPADISSSGIVPTATGVWLGALATELWTAGTPRASSIASGPRLSQAVVHTAASTVSAVSQETGFRSKTKAGYRWPPRPFS